MDPNLRQLVWQSWKKLSPVKVESRKVTSPVVILAFYIPMEKLCLLHADGNIWCFVGVFFVAGNLSVGCFYKLNLSQILQAWKRRKRLRTIPDNLATRTFGLKSFILRPYFSAGTMRVNCRWINTTQMKRLNSTFKGFECRRTGAAWQRTQIFHWSDPLLLHQYRKWIDPVKTNW